MKNEVRMHLTVESTVGTNGEDIFLRYETNGVWRCTGGVSSLSFTETREDVKVFTTLTYRTGARRVHMKCRGGIKSELVFDPTTPHASVYEVSPYRFDITVRSREVSVTLDETGGDIRLHYTRELGGDRSPVRYTLHATPLPEEEVQIL